jgi:hypothetical protein
MVLTDVNGNLKDGTNFELKRRLLQEEVYHPNVIHLSVLKNVECTIYTHLKESPPTQPMRVDMRKP